MRAARNFSVLLLLLAGAPMAAQATLYKWVDENGVVNYGDTPPSSTTQTTQLDESKSSLSVVPGLSKEELAQMRERAAQARVERLEQEVAELRARAATPPVYDTAPVAYAPTYVPLVVTRHLPPHRTRLPMHGTPVQKTPPFPSMKLER
jgi:hypothetical protein